MATKNTLEGKITYRVKRSADSVFVREDFADLGSYHQVGRILRHLVQKELLIRIGYGLYARTRQSILSNDKVPEKSLQELAREALKKLGVKVIPTKFERLYNSGRSTQVPTGRVIGVQGRITRKIGYKMNYLSYEECN